MSLSRPLRVLHIGNIANNAHNIAKALRERAGVEADCYTNHYRHCISQPEWEDADIDAVPCDDAHPVDWGSVDLRGFRRPDWYFETRDEALRRLRSLAPVRRTLRMLGLVQSQGADAAQVALWREICSADRALSPQEAGQMEALAAGHLPLRDARFPTASAWRDFLRRRFRDLCMPPHRALMPEDYAADEQNFLPLLLREYDIIQTYGAWELIFPILHAPSIPRVTFEHGTMREIPFQDSHLGRKAMLAYRTAFANIITNADSIRSIRRMGLENCVFIPHPVDDGKFRPQPDAAFRAALLREHDATRLFLAPARQNWELKGNDRMLRAFARLIREVGRGPKLLLGAWGQEIERSQALARDLHVEEHVSWLPPLPKRLLARYVNASDAVLDQFILGAFGTTTPEAMACARPVLLFYRAEDHRWCLPEDPPVCNVRTEDEIFSALRHVHDDPEWARERGRRCLEWFRKHHSLDVVVERHMEIYRRIEHAPHCLAVPADIVAGESLMDKSIVCVVDCPQASPGDARIWLEGIRGQSALEILDTRLRRIHPRIALILSLDEAMPELEKEARRLGWPVFRPPHALARFLSQCRPGILRRILGADFAYVCTPEQPFMDAEQIAAWGILRSDPAGITCGENRTDNPHVPQRVYTRAFVTRRFLLRLLFRRHFTRPQCQSVMVRYGMNIPPTALPSGMPRLTLRTFEALGPRLSPAEFTTADLRAMPAERDLLKERMAAAEHPHELNARLNELECRDRAEELESFPPFVGLNMTSRCSARCQFCSIQPERQAVKDAISLEDVKKMGWLRNVGQLAVWGGIGDSLVNREFPDIIRHLREVHPHLDLTLFTNGILMNEDLCRLLAGNLVLFNVSLNAATKDTWEKLMRSRGFDNVCSAFARLAELRPSRRAPRMGLSMVLTRDNIHEAVPFVELAHSLGADQVTFTHYLPSTLVGARDLPADQSLYLDRERSDAELLKAMERADALGLDFAGPTLFNKKADFIHFGARAMTECPPCADPWKTCQLTVDEDGRRQMIFCCSGFYYAIGYDKASLDEEHFRRLWNHPMARYFRRTVNRKGANPICTNCTTTDRFNPENRKLYAINELIQPYFQEVHRRHMAGDDVTTDEISGTIDNMLKNLRG